MYQKYDYRKKRTNTINGKYLKKVSKGIPKGFKISYRSGKLVRIEGFFEGNEKMPEFEKIYLAEKHFFSARKKLKNAVLLLKNRKRRDNRSVIGQKI